MSKGLDVIIVEDDPDACELISSKIKRFYIWGKVLIFMDADKAIEYCLSRDGLAIFVVDVYLGHMTGFDFLKAVAEKFPDVYADAIMITGNASDEIVARCLETGVNHLLEKPIEFHTLQLALRSLVQKYLKFAKRLFKDPEYGKLIKDQ